MASTDLTTSSAVRAVLGVSAKELPDDVLLEPVYTTLLTSDLRVIHPQIINDFAEIAEVAEDARTEAEEDFFNLMQMYAAYHIAKRCLGAVAMFAPTTIQDARSEMTRAGDPYRALREDVLATLPILKVRLRSVYALVNPDAPVPTAVERIRVLVATPVNPVTGA